MRRIVAGLMVVALLLYSGFAMTRPAGPVTFIPEAPSVAAPDGGEKFVWPSSGQAAVGAIGYGTLGSSGKERVVPTASIAKVIAALAILKQRPLIIGQQGPSLTLTTQDVQVYNEFIAKNGSVVAVENGEQITEYQALQAIMLPSANNMAVSATRWAFGSDDNYLKYANQFVAEIGMYNTTVSGSSGYEAETTSTPSDLLILGQYAMQNPIFAEIVGQKEATIPVEGKIRNSNGLIGTQNYVGIKTGSSEEAGGCYLFAVKQPFEGGQSVMLVGVVLGAPDRDTAIFESKNIAQQAAKQFERVKVLSAGQKVGVYRTPGGKDVPVISKTDQYAVLQREETVSTSVDMQSDPTLTSHFVVRQRDNIIRLPVEAESGAPKPSLLWRLTHVF